MASAVHMITMEHRLSVHAPDYSLAVWLIDPDIVDVLGLRRRYWKLGEGNAVARMAADERQAVRTARGIVKLPEEPGEV